MLPACKIVVRVNCNKAYASSFEVEHTIKCCQKINSEKDLFDGVVDYFNLESIATSLQNEVKLDCEDCEIPVITMAGLTDTAVKEALSQALADIYSTRIPSKVFLCGTDIENDIAEVAAFIAEHGAKPTIIYDFVSSRQGSDALEAGISEFEKTYGVDAVMSFSDFAGLMNLNLSDSQGNYFHQHDLYEEIDPDDYCGDSDDDYYHDEYEGYDDGYGEF